MRFPNTKYLLLALLSPLVASVFSFSFRDKILYPLSFAELSLPKSSNRPACDPKVAAHRGYGRGDKALENHWESVQAAIDKGIKGIEVDFQILEDGIVLEHEPLHFSGPATIEEYEKLTGNSAFTLREFLDNHAGRFEYVFYDLKGVHTGKPEALYERLSFDRERDFLIGRSCRLLSEMQKHFGLRASCERHGLIGNLLLSFDFLSVDHRRINIFHTGLVPLMDFPLLIWTFADRAALQTDCPMDAEYAILTDL